MILGYRITKLREGLTLSKTQLAHEVGVSMSTLTKWENGESTPTKRNLEILAIKLYTTTDYLEGIIDSPSTTAPEMFTEKILIPLQPGMYEVREIPFLEKLHEAHQNRWRMRWPESILNSSRLENRREYSHLADLISLDREKPEAIFGSSTDNDRTTYITTLEMCTCRDFEMTRGEIPCKHILRLASELGLFQSEDFVPNEDYTVHIAQETPDEDSASVNAKKSACIFHKNGFVEAVFQISNSQLLNDSGMRPSYLPSESEMAEWKSKLFECKTVEDGIQLIGDLKLTIPKIMEFAKYLGVSLSGCEYLKAEIVKWLIDRSLGAKLESDEMAQKIKTASSS